ncbi:MAG TPA: helix-turn-helix transcriptional regulator [Acidimicrobiales bacterium]|nr:helix-turn-helix transcriptional regulator [Acidimicrobiales bacterium]
MVQVMQDDVAIRRFEDELSSPRKILRACLLLLLEERPGHGYDLLTRLEPLGFERSNPGRVYRALRWLESAGFVQPTWETTGVGPARRVYELSPSGRHALEVSAPVLRKQAKSLDERLSKYILGRLRVLANNKQSFEFTIQAHLSVQAMDEVSARRKLERTFGQPHVLDTDVRTTGDVSIRSAS